MIVSARPRGLFLVRLLVALGLASPAALGAADGARLLRFPDIHDDRVVFVQAGDVWIAPSGGGQARRLTTDQGMELFPKFSPDGRWVAFSGEYNGNRQVYVVPASGGTPRQLTFYNDVGPLPPRGGFDYQVLDWTPDGEHVLFRGNRLPWGVRMGRPFLVPVAGGMPRALPVPESGGGMLSPDGRSLVYTPIAREFRTWKRYRGGRAQDVWIFDLAGRSARQITDDPATDNQPLWVGETVYFTSDRKDGRLNLWARDLAGGTARQVTDHDDFDVLWPSAGPRQIVYECGGWLYRYRPGAGDPQRLSIELSGDFPGTVPRQVDVSGHAGSADLSPTGKRAVFAARGDLFSVPAERGETRNLTRSPGVREMEPAWSPDGTRVVYLSDRSGEYEIYVRAADGSGDERRVTTDGDVWRHAPVWSPDGTMLAFGDRRQRLRYVSLDGGGVVEVDRGHRADIDTYRWSPDSRWLVYDKQDDTGFSSLFVYSVERGEVQRLTDEATNDWDPVFDPEGRWLYFLSDRDYNLTFSGYEFNYFYTDPTRVYAATLAAGGPAFLAPKSDDEPGNANGNAPAESARRAKRKRKPRKTKAEEGTGGAAEAPRVEIDAAGFPSRVAALPGPAADYRSLHATGEAVLFLAGSGAETAVRMFSLESEKTATVISGVRGFTVSRDGKKLLYAQGETFGIVAVEADREPGSGKLDLSGLRVRIDPRAEWRQIYVDAYRIVRDWFYDPGMHGLDWAGLRDLYAPLVEHVAHRGDLDYILGELGGELNAGHVYVGWGDLPGPERVEGGLLGAEIEAHESGYFRVARIFPGENWHPAFRSPLTEAGVGVHEGDFLLAIDGRSTREVDNVYELLEGSADRLVRLSINDRLAEEGARETLVRPIARETNLRYLDWVRSRRALVDRLSGGRIGYLHLPNTAGAGNRELRKGFYPQARKDALIVDVRYNGGGFIPDRMIELLARTQLSFWARRGVEPMRTPGYAHVGPKVCLINGYSASGGDAFPYYFRKLGLGKLIGTRTWGGLIGLTGNPSFVDGGSIAVPTFRFLDTEGNWAVENEGVAPDIEVVDRPDLVAAGQDPTLERAVHELLAELERNPPREVEPPAPPRHPR